MLCTVGSNGKRGGAVGCYETRVGEQEEERYETDKYGNSGRRNWEWGEVKRGAEAGNSAQLGSIGYLRPLV